MVPFKGNNNKTGDPGGSCCRGEQPKTPISGLKVFLEKLYKILKGEKIKPKP
jgi:hypothetical protein